MNIHQNVNSISLALMICSRAMTQLLNFPKSSILVFFLGFLIIFIKNASAFFNMKKILICLYVGIFFAFTVLLCGKNSTTIEYLLYFVVFGVLSFLMPYCFNFRMVLRSILVCGFILLWSYINIDFVAIASNLGGQYENPAAILMDISYKTLVFVISALILAVTEEKWYFKVLALMVFFPYMVISFAYGARGALLSVAIFVILFWLLRSKNKKVMHRRLLFAGIMCLLVFVFFPLIIESMFSFLDSRGISARSVERLYNAVTSDSSMSEGRSLLTKQALSGIINSPIWGHGIGSFDNFSGVYPHNIILQLLYEGGLLLLVPVFILLVRGFRTMLDINFSSDYRLFLLMLFCSGIIELFLSSHLWMSLFLWLFLGLGMLRNRFFYGYSKEI